MKKLLDTAIGRRNRRKKAAEATEEFESMTFEQAVGVLWNPNSKYGSKAKQSVRRNRKTQNIIAITTDYITNKGLSYSQIPSCEKDDVTWSDGIHFIVPRLEDTTPEQIALGIDRRPLETFSHRDGENTATKMKLRIPLGTHPRSSTIHSEVEVYYYTLAILDIIRTANANSEVISKVLYMNNGSSSESAAVAWGQETLDLYYEIIRRRREYVTLEDLPGLEKAFSQILENTIIPMGTGNLRLIKDTFLLGTAGSGKSSMLRVLEHGDIYKEYGFLILAVGVDNALQLVDKGFGDAIKRFCRRFGWKGLAISNDSDILIQPVSENKSQVKHDPITRQFLLDTLGGEGSVEPPFRNGGSLNHSSKVDPAIARRVNLIYVPAFFKDRDTQLKIIDKALTFLINALQAYDESIIDYSIIAGYGSKLCDFLIDHPPSFFFELMKRIYGKIVRRVFVLRNGAPDKKISLTDKEFYDILNEAYQEESAIYPLESTREMDGEIRELYERLKKQIDYNKRPDIVIETPDGRRIEYIEQFGEDGEILGWSPYFVNKRTGKPEEFVPLEYILRLAKNGDNGTEEALVEA